MSATASGGRSTFYAQEIAAKWFPISGSQRVEIVREVTLSDDLSEIETRRLRSIRVRPGNRQGEKDGTGAPVDLARDAAIYLRDALTHAIDATEGEVTAP